jgi:aminocyclitol acetyltransferase
MHDGVFIGKYVTTGGAYTNCLGNKSQHDCINSIGRYTSINGTSYMNVDHAQGLTTNHRVLYDMFSIKSKPPAKLNSFLVPSNRITIGSDVTIGARTFINASKVKTIGNGAIIGAGAVLVEDVPPYAIVVGMPAKVKKYRFTEKQITILERVQWWNWDEETMMKNADCFKDYNLFFEKFD